ncbi:biopolymer transporter ExbD [Gammaproteobacteria bacterium 45_16_T64]|nr:biopolymer transporter ExbD [Gammaproteobacteria bacterium 45_16_T64]
MKFIRQPVEEATVNLTPLIDVVFLLLIFFMVSTTFTKERQLVINLPEAVGEAPTEDPLQIEIVISADGEYAVNGKRLVNRELATLRKAIIEVSEGNMDLPLTISADKDTAYQSVISAMDVAGRLGFTQQSLPISSLSK